MSYLMNQLRFGGVLIFLLLFIGLLIIWMIDTVTTPVVKGPYQETNRAVLESAKPRDLIICAYYKPRPAFPAENVKVAMVEGNNGTALHVVMFYKLFAEHLYEVDYTRFGKCNASIVKDRAEQVKIIGEAILSGPTSAFTSAD